MTTVKLFRHGGSQAVRLPKAFRFEGTEVLIEKDGDSVILKPKPKPAFKTLGDFARHLAEKFPEGADFPDVERTQEYEKRDLTW